MEIECFRPVRVASVLAYPIIAIGLESVSVSKDNIDTDTDSDPERAKTLTRPCRGHPHRSKNTKEWWIGWIEEVPGVNCQEKSKDELMATLRVTLKEALEFNRTEALASAGSEFLEEKIAV